MIHKFLIVDINSLIYKYGYATKDYINQSGQNVGGVSATLRHIIKVIKKFDISYVIIAVDDSQNFRKQLYHNYKNNRKTTPDFIIQQLKMILEIFHILKIPVISKIGYEADDIIASVNKHLNQQYKNNQQFICTTDKDILQLVSHNTSIVMRKNNMWLHLKDAERVKQFLGVFPNQITDLIALEGDKSDNIPGVYGIGHKKAINWLENFKTLEYIIKNIDKITNSRDKKLLYNDIENALLSKELSTLTKNINVSEYTFINTKYCFWSQNNEFIDYLKKIDILYEI